VLPIIRFLLLVWLDNKLSEKEPGDQVIVL